MEPESAGRTGRQRSARHPLVGRFCSAVSEAVVAGLVAATLGYELRLLRTATPVGPYPMSVYVLAATPGTSPVAGAPGAAGADFSQVYTSIGVTHLERGQFDLWVATASVLAVGCVFLPGGELALAGLSGLLGAVNWTAVAFLGSFSALGFLLGWGRKRWAFLAIPLATAVGTLPFWRGLTDCPTSITPWPPWA